MGKEDMTEDLQDWKENDGSGSLNLKKQRLCNGKEISPHTINYKTAPLSFSYGVLLNTRCFIKL